MVLINHSHAEIIDLWCVILFRSFVFPVGCYSPMSVPSRSQSDLRPGAILRDIEHGYPILNYNFLYLKSLKVKFKA
jgi:hypothetical protein